MSLKKSKIYVAGHNGLVGSAIIRRLKFFGYKNIITIDRERLDLTNQLKVLKFLKKTKPKFIIIAAAKVGGINANNKYRADFIYENLSIQNNLIHGAYLNKIKNIIFLGSSCVFPKNCKQPIKEKYLLNGVLDTNYKCLMPSNTYGPGDNYDLETSHFYPALIKKILNAKKKMETNIILWGTGRAKRELIYVDDLADACIFFMNKKTKENLINIGVGKDYTIKQYAEFISKYLNYPIQIKFDKTKPDGTKRKLLDISVAKRYGWSPKVSLKSGFFKTIKYLDV